MVPQMLPAFDGLQEARLLVSNARTACQPRDNGGCSLVAIAARPLESAMSEGMML